MRIAVAGGTGVVGRHVVEAATAAGHTAVVLSRRTGVDLVAGTGLDSALDGVDAVVDVSNVVTVRAAESVRWFEAATTHLLGASARAGTRHVVGLSIVGANRVDFGYYMGKRRQEELLLSPRHGVPASVLRATQFHEFAGQLLSRSRGPVAVIPTMRCQPIAAREVAAALVALAAGPAVGLAPELAGPQPETLAELARQQLGAVGSRRRVLQVRLPGAAGKGFASGALLPTDPAPRGAQTFAQWLVGPDGPRRP